LVTHGTRHPPEEGGHFRTGLREPEDVIDEEERFRSRAIAEPLGHRQGRQGDAEAGTRRFVHLAEDHRTAFEHRLGVGAGVGLGFLHFEPEVVPLAGPLADAGEDRVALVNLCNPVDEFGEDDCLSKTGPAEQAGLAPPNERSEQVDHLDAGDEHLGLRRQVAELRRLAVDAAGFLGHDRGTAVDRLAQEVEYAAQRFEADRDRDRAAGVGGAHPADQAVGAAQGDAADAVAAEVLLHLADQDVREAALAGRFDAKGVVNVGQVAGVELDVERRTDDLDNLPGLRCGGNHRTLRGAGLRIYRFGTRKLRWWAQCTN